MRLAVHRAAPDPGHVGVPGVRVQHVRIRDGRRHLEVGGQRTQGGVRLGQFGRRPVGVHAWFGARRAERVHVHLDDAAQLTDEELDVDPGAPVNLRRILPGQHRNAHERDPRPAVPFGGNYRLIDFVLSNLVNAGYLRICVLTQYKSHSLDRHITQTWRMSTVLGNYVTPVPAQQRLGPRWYTGSADAILQSANLIYDDKPDYVVVFGADHVYRMDPRQMVNQHIESGAAATVAGIRVPRKEATAFGVIDAAVDRKVRGFLEKPAEPPGLPDSPD